MRARPTPAIDGVGARTMRTSALRWRRSMSASHTLPMCRAVFLDGEIDRVGARRERCEPAFVLVCGRRGAGDPAAAPAQDRSSTAAFRQDAAGRRAPARRLTAARSFDVRHRRRLIHLDLDAEVLAHHFFDVIAGALQAPSASHAASRERRPATPSSCGTATPARPGRRDAAADTS